MKCQRRLAIGRSLLFSVSYAILSKSKNALGGFVWKITIHRSNFQELVNINTDVEYLFTIIHFT